LTGGKLLDACPYVGKLPLDGLSHRDDISLYLLRSSYLSPAPFSCLTSFFKRTPRAGPLWGLPVGDVSDDTNRQAPKNTGHNGGPHRAHERCINVARTR
jgi:hypothetical protein